MMEDEFMVYDGVSQTYLQEGNCFRVIAAIMILTKSSTYTGLLYSSLKNLVCLPAFRVLTMNCKKRRRDTGRGGCGPYIRLDRSIM